MDGRGSDELLGAGRDALAAADWPAARVAFEAALDLDPSSGEALDELSEVANFERDYETSINLKERAFAAYREAGAQVEAADAARWLAFVHATYHGNYSVAAGWLGRGRRCSTGSTSAPPTAG